MKFALLIFFCIFYMTFSIVTLISKQILPFIFNFIMLLFSLCASFVVFSSERENTDGKSNN
jgi:succinate-acetate transporter protein